MRAPDRRTPEDFALLARVAEGPHPRERRCTELRGDRHEAPRRVREPSARAAGLRRARASERDPRGLGAARGSRDEEGVGGGPRPLEDARRRLLDQAELLGSSLSDDEARVDGAEVLAAPGGEHGADVLVLVGRVEGFDELHRGREPAHVGGEPRHEHAHLRRMLAPRSRLRRGDEHEDERRLTDDDRPADANEHVRLRRSVNHERRGLFARRDTRAVPLGPHDQVVARYAGVNEHQIGVEGSPDDPRGVLNEHLRSGVFAVGDDEVEPAAIHATRSRARAVKKHAQRSRASVVLCSRLDSASWSAGRWWDR